MLDVAFGLKAHSGWAALAVVGREAGEPVVVDRRRIELAGEPWERFLYHAAKDLEPDEGRALVKRGVDAAHRMAADALQAAVKREQARSNRVVACAVLVGDPMADWTVAEIVAVHFRMHKAEGALFRDALVAAGWACKLEVVEIPEKTLPVHAERALEMSAASIAARLAAIGKSLGPPWGKDQRDGALAARAALQGRAS